MGKKMTLRKILFIIFIIILILIPIYIDFSERIRKNNYATSIKTLTDITINTCKKEKEEGNLVSTKYIFDKDGVKPNIDTKEVLPTEGNILLDGDCNATVYIANEKYVVNKLPNDSEYNVTDYINTIVASNIKYENSHVVYFNPVNGLRCNDYKEENSNTGANNTCMKWYVYDDSETSSTVKLILDHNLNNSVQWNSNGSNQRMNEIINSLNSSTSSWKGGLNKKIITANEIANITKNNWNAQAKRTYFYFDSNTEDNSNTCMEGDLEGCKYGWLYDRTSMECTKYGCLNNSDIETYGYWTSDPRSGFADTAWNITYKGRLNYASVNSFNIGLRPAITISKENL